MALEEDVTQLRKKALAQRRPPVPDAFQGVTKARIDEVLREIDRYTPDCADTVFALLDDEHAHKQSLEILTRLTYLLVEFPNPHITMPFGTSDTIISL